MAHRLDGLGRALLRSLDLIPDGQNGALDAVKPAFRFGRIETTHHLGAVALDLTAQRLGQLFETCSLASTLRLNPSLGGAQPLVQTGERSFQPAQGLGRPPLRLIETGTDLGQKIGTDAGPGSRLNGIHALAELVHARSLAFLDVVQSTGQGTERGLHLAEGLGRAGSNLLLETTQTLVALAQLLGDVVDATGSSLAVMVLIVEAPHQPGNRLIHALDGDGRAAFSGFQPGSDGVNGGGQAVPWLIAATVSVVDAAAAAAPFIAVGGVRATRQRHHTLVVVFHDHGVQPLAQRHAGAARKVFGDLAGLGLDALNAPRRGCAH